MGFAHRIRDLKAWSARTPRPSACRPVMSALPSGLMLVCLLLISAWPVNPALAQATPASPASPATVTLPADLKAALPAATPVGGGAYRWFGLKLYDIRLWADRKVIKPDNWSTTPLALELVYARALVGERIAKASIDEIRQLGLGKPAQQAEWLEAMKRVFPDVAEGTQLIGIYAPGKPTQFLRDGQVVGEIADPDFGQAFFAIWLHPKTSAPNLRALLFGQKP